MSLSHAQRHVVSTVLRLRGLGKFVLSSDMARPRSNSSSVILFLSKPRCHLKNVSSSKWKGMLDRTQLSSGKPPIPSLYCHQIRWLHETEDTSSSLIMFDGWFIFYSILPMEIFISPLLTSSNRVLHLMELDTQSLRTILLWRQGLLNIFLLCPGTKMMMTMMTKTFMLMCMLSPSTDCGRLLMYWLSGSFQCYWVWVIEATYSSLYLCFAVNIQLSYW